MTPFELETRYSAHNYEPLPVVLTHGAGAHLFDADGRRYIDMMSAYSAASHGHGHPRILARFAGAGEPARGAFARLLQRPARSVPGRDCASAPASMLRLPMNTGAEAVETAIKAARRWGYRVKGIAHDRAEIIVAEGNFHGRTTTIVGFSSEPDYKDGFGPFAPGFRSVPFGDLAAMERAITQKHRGDPDRADPGRGRHHRAAGRLHRGRARALRRA